MTVGAKVKRKRQPYRVGTAPFPTKEAVTKACQEILYSYNLMEPLKDEDTNFLLDLLKHHPRGSEKILGTTNEVVVAENEYKGRGFLLALTEGGYRDFSFMKCIRAMKREDI